MNQKSFVLAAIIAATALSVIATPFAYADTSATATGQSVEQKNTGSGDKSTNFNCGQNLIKAGVEDQECEFED
jgi:uncharacterized low-complexity protein